MSAPEPSKEGRLAAGVDELPMVEEDLPTEEGRRLFEDQAKEVWKIVQKGADDFDKSILTYSASALGLSVAFIQNVVPKEHAVHLFYLFSAWICFTLAILLTVVSFKVSAAAQYKHLDHCKEYYLHQKQEYLTKRNWWNLGNEVLTLFAGLSFTLGVVGIAVFGILNFKEVQTMANKAGIQGDAQKGAPTNIKIPTTPAATLTTAPSNGQSSSGTGQSK